MCKQDFPHVKQVEVYVHLAYQLLLPQVPREDLGCARLDFRKVSEQMSRLRVLSKASSHTKAVIGI